MADVFVSYKREDVARVRKLVEALRASGLDIWWDEDIPPSAPWEATIEKALAEAKAVIVCWSPDAVASENVRSEARAAREDGRLIQVFVKPCTLPLFFGERQGIDLTNWRGRAGDKRLTDLADAVREKTGTKTVTAEAPRSAGLKIRVAAIVAALVLVVGAGVGWWLLSPARASGPKTIAILPFRALNPSDANLVDAIWDDTRGAISHNPNLRVLGRTAVEALARQNLAPMDYRRKVGADYLLDGGVERQGDRVEINVSLVSTTDGSEVWSDRIAGKLDDVFAFQQRIAQEVEGKIRGRLAPENGVKVQNIATGGDVYATYADARAEIRKRDPEAMSRAIGLLKRAISLDPNYAPAWADLGIATVLSRAPGTMVAERQQEAIGYLKKALSLAPNLAHAHAALAMAQNFPASSEADLKRAVVLDPGDAEAWHWLGNFYSSRYRNRDAAAAHRRAVEIEPVWFPPKGQLLGELASIKDSSAIDAEVAKAERIGDAVYAAKVRAYASFVRGHPGDYIREMLALRRDHPEEAPFIDLRISDPLFSIGYADLSDRLAHYPPAFSAGYRGSISSMAQLSAFYKRPADFWKDEEICVVVGRQLRKAGKLGDYAAYFRAAFPNGSGFAEQLDSRPNLYVAIAPTVAVSLRDAGDTAVADQILARAEAIVGPWLRDGPTDNDLAARVSLLRAAEGRDDDAVRLLRAAVGWNWLPDGGAMSLDIAEEPAYARLLNRADFQALRRQILAHQADERRRAGPVQTLYAALGQKMAA